MGVRYPLRRMIHARAGDVRPARPPSSQPFPGAEADAGCMAGAA